MFAMEPRRFPALVATVEVRPKHGLECGLSTVGSQLPYPQFSVLSHEQKISHEHNTASRLIMGRNGRASRQNIFPSDGSTTNFAVASIPQRLDHSFQ